MNRLCAIKELGWTHAPAIVTGPIDKWEIPGKRNKITKVALEGVLLTTVEEVNSYFVGGRFKLYQNHEVGFQNDLIPEKGKYPTTRRDPYFRDDAPPSLVLPVDADEDDSAALDASISGQETT